MKLTKREKKKFLKIVDCLCIARCQELGRCISQEAIGGMVDFASHLKNEIANIKEESDV